MHFSPMTLTFTVSTNSTCPWNNSLLLIKILIILVRSEQKSSIIVVSFQIFLVWGNLLKTVYFLFLFDLDPPRKLLCKIIIFLNQRKTPLRRRKSSNRRGRRRRKKCHAEFELILKTCLVYLLFFEGPSVIKTMAELSNS